MKSLLKFETEEELSVTVSAYINLGVLTCEDLKNPLFENYGSALYLASTSTKVLKALRKMAEAKSGKLTYSTTKLAL